MNYENKINYEKQTFLERALNFPRLFFLYLLSILPFRLGINIFIRSSKHTNRIRKYAKTFKALELMYTYKGLNFEEGILEGFLSEFWETIINNPKALRNRLKLMKYMFRNILNQFKGKNIKILSLASGSGRGVIEVLGELKYRLNFHITFIDRNIFANKFSQKLANSLGLSKFCNWIKEDLDKFLKNNSNQKFDVIEMVGFLDYLDDASVINILRKVHLILNENGYLIAANVKPNPEKYFLDKVVNWKMFYRNKNDLIDVITKSGFNKENCEIVSEPFNIHNVFVVKK